MCPYGGKQDPLKVRDMAEELLSLGSYQVSLGETIGIATPHDIHHLFKSLNRLDVKQLAVHFHDTYGQALANVLASLEYGVEWVDASVNGLGGCPYAEGAAGNLATEEVVYMLKGMGVLKEEIDMDRLVEAGQFINEKLGRNKHSKLTNALLSKLKK